MTLSHEAQMLLELNVKIESLIEEATQGQFRDSIGNVGKGRELSLCITKLQEASHWLSDALTGLTSQTGETKEKR